jgi:hypothetical protein
MTEQPKVTPFKYILIPCDDTVVQERTFSGSSDDDLRRTIKSHFSGKTLSNSQRCEMQLSVAKAASEKSAEKAVDPNLLEQVVGDTSFEIVPITLPSRGNRFIGSSLYIDDAGRFKELPLNSRASRIAQKDIRGDAFLLSNHDDPALDVWERVDCGIDVYNSLIQCPPQTTLDTSNQKQMAAAGAVRESDSKLVSEEDAQTAKKARLEGNQLFGQGKFTEAETEYSAAISMTEGRRDFLANEKEVTNIRLLSFLNRSLCRLKLSKWTEAALDAKSALVLDERNVKGLFRLATAEFRCRDFDAAESALAGCESAGGISEETSALRTEIAAGRRQLQKEEQKKYSKAFRSS